MMSKTGVYMSAEDRIIGADEAQSRGALSKTADQLAPEDVLERMSLEDGEPIDVEAWQEVRKQVDTLLLPLENSARQWGEAIVEYTGVNRPNIHVTLSDGGPQAPTDPTQPIEHS
jgi:hypothetical protein